MMNRRLLRLFILMCGFLLSSTVVAANSGIYETHPYELQIKKIVSKFSESYVMNALSEVNSNYPPTYPGRIKKSAFRIRTNYDLSDQHGWQATGITRLLSMGALYPWATDIDIYDTRGVRIGMIDGNMVTLESAKFNLYRYDDEGNSTQVGVVLANADFTHFAITSPYNYLPIGDINRHPETQSWTVSIYVPEIIDDRIIRILSGFIINYEDKFKNWTLDKPRSNTSPSPWA